MVLPAIAIILIAVAVLAIVIFGMTDWWELLFIVGVVGFIFWTGGLKIAI